MSINSRLKNLRELMKAKKIEAYIVNTADPHQSEYIADHYKSRVWISGFTGSAGTVIVTNNQAILWTDGRYFVQAENELSASEFKLYKMKTPGYPSYSKWLKDNLKDGDTIGFNGDIFPESQYEEIVKKMDEKDIKFNADVDLIGELWKDRPELKKGKVFVHDVKYAGKGSKEKIEKVREEMKKQDLHYHVLGSLDDIAWLFNIRGNDVEFNPVVLSYAVIAKDKALIFVDIEKFDEQVVEHLKENNITIEAYDRIINYLESIDGDSRVYLDKKKINRSVFKAIPESCKIISGTDITTSLKARKDSVEIENQKNAYIKDGLALVKFFIWLDKNVGNKDITEYTAQEKLLEFRSKNDKFIEASFETIAGYKENAAMMHYSASKENALQLKKEGMFLVDSGGQYLDGTTDITRTVILGEISDEEKKDFTLTLKSNINLSTARFLHGATGYSLDALCRYPMWQEGLDYKCGTGHGVGYLLNVHEGPQRIANASNDVVLEEGMVVTIEPGVYKENKHGVRIENVFVIKEDIKTDSGQFMKFEILSFVPIDLEGLKIEMLTDKELNWLNDYHAEVYDKLSPHLNQEEKEWLKEETKQINR